MGIINSQVEAVGGRGKASNNLKIDVENIVGSKQNDKSLPVQE